jgi:acyl-CoA thioesterase-1
MNTGGTTPLIVCFGDSLTAGYQSPTPGHPGFEETPYGAFLQARLEGRALVAVSGICGELTGEMLMRFREDVLRPAPAWVVILGGTNDLGCNLQPVAIMANLSRMYELTQAAGIKPVAVTVPSIRVGPLDTSSEARQWLTEHIARRRTLNRLIAESCASQGFACVDLFTETADAGTLELAAPYSNDGLHLTTEGYERLAMLLYEQIFATAVAET